MTTSKSNPSNPSNPPKNQWLLPSQEDLTEAIELVAVIEKIALARQSSPKAVLLAVRSIAVGYTLGEVGEDFDALCASINDFNAQIVEAFTGKGNPNPKAN